MRDEESMCKWTGKERRGERIYSYQELCFNLSSRQRAWQWIFTEF